MQTFSALPAALFASIFVAACNVFPARVEVKEDFSFSKPVAGHSALTLTNVNGTVTVTGVDGLTSAEIKGVRIVGGSSHGDASSHLADLKVDVSESGETIVVKTEQPSVGFRNSYTVNYNIRVPKNWQVRTENVNGDVTIASITRDVNASVTNGDIMLNGVAGILKAESTNGSIAGDAAIPDNGSCVVETTNGSVTLRMMLGSGADTRMETTNGSIDLQVPKGTSASVKAEAGTGSIGVHDLGLASADRDEPGAGATLKGALGDAKGSLVLQTTNGSIDLKGY
ncbi:MAG: hypothetical protein JST22_07235 [Bacteroidetes bacterium]|nr:hypothetical protein [Bacteroidota bacterium]